MPIRARRRSTIALLGMSLAVTLTGTMTTPRPAASLHPSPDITPDIAPGITVESTVDTTVDTALARSVADSARGRAPVIVAAGDIADDGPAKYATASTAADLSPTRVLALGDLAYDNGTLDEFRLRWRPSWGRFDDVVWPLPGNHEHRTPNAAGFRDYFGITGPTWWSRRAGRWLIIGLDSRHPDDEAQLTFVERRLAAHDGRPTMVAWHHPRFSSGMHGNDTAIEPLWNAVARDPDVRIALWAHDHHYEHLAVTVPGRTTRIHAFVVGTGGAPLRRATHQPLPGTRARIDDQHGVLRLRLGRERWRWAFVNVDGERLDRGRRPITTTSVGR